MDFTEKCIAAGIGDGSVCEGYPVVNGRIIRKLDGQLKAFFNESLKGFEEPREDKDFPKATLDKIQAVEDGKLGLLTQAEQDAIAAAEAEELEEKETPSITEIWKKVKELESELTAKG